MASTDLTFRIYGKDVNASKALAGVGKQAKATGGKLSGAFAMLPGPAGIATAAAAAVVGVGAALFDAAKAAAEDEASASKLAKTLKNVTKATDAQVASVEDYIDTTQRATGVADDQLRPALAQLVRATGDAQKAQDLLNTALDVSAATGKPVEAISLALSKAYSGNSAALGRLGISMKDANGKALPFEQAIAKLNKTFGGQAATAANTYDGKMKRLNISLDELKESIGYKVLPLVQKFADWLINTGVPTLESWWETFDKQVVPVLVAYVKPAVEAVQSAFKDMGKAVSDNQDFVDDLMTVLKPLAAFSAGQMALSLKAVAAAFRAVLTYGTLARNILGQIGIKFGEVQARIRPFISALQVMAGAVRSAFLTAFNAIRSAWNSTLGGFHVKTPDVPGTDWGGLDFTIPAMANGGIVTRPTLALIGEAGPEAVVPLSRGRGIGGPSVVVNVNNAVVGNEQQVADTVIRALQRAQGRGYRLGLA